MTVQSTFLATDQEFICYLWSQYLLLKGFESIFLCLQYVRNILREFCYNWHKRQHGLKDELFRIWWWKVEVYCDLTNAFLPQVKHLYAKYVNIHLLLISFNVFTLYESQQTWVYTATWLVCRSYNWKIPKQIINPFKQISRPTYYFTIWQEHCHFAASNTVEICPEAVPTHVRMSVLFQE